MDYIIALIAGAVGAYILAMVMEKFSQGMAMNLGVGVVGGVIGQGTVNLLTGSPQAPEGGDGADAAAAAAGTGAGSIIVAIIAGLVGGAVLLAIVGAARGRQG